MNFFFQMMFVFLFYLLPGLFDFRCRNNRRGFLFVNICLKRGGGSIKTKHVLT